MSNTSSAYLDVYAEGNEPIVEMVKVAGYLVSGKQRKTSNGIFFSFGAFNVKQNSC